MYCQVNKGMYGLKQAAILAYKLLVQRLKDRGYHPIPLTTGLFKHESRATTFALCVDDFGVKFNNEDNLQHLIDTLRQHFEISIDKDGRNYCGLTFTWHYKQGYVDVSMPKYMMKALAKFAHPKPHRAQYSPHRWNKPTYGQRVQYVTPDKLGTPLDMKGQRRVQSIVGTFLYCGRAVEQTILPALNDIASFQARPTSDTVKRTNRLMDYMYTYPTAVLRYYAGDMQLHIESDVAYLVLPGARSCVAGYSYLRANKHPQKAYPGHFNAPILVEFPTLKNVVSSVAEAECGGLFHNCTTAIGLRNDLIGLVHPQNKTPVITDTSTAKSFVHSEMRVKRSKSWDMRFNWLRDRAAQKQFDIKWDKGIHNMADYFTKHHPPSHHHNKRSNYILHGS